MRYKNDKDRTNEHCPNVTCKTTFHVGTFDVVQQTVTRLESDLRSRPIKITYQNMAGTMSNS